jgi:hypothetical protein
VYWRGRKFKIYFVLVKIRLKCLSPTPSQILSNWTLGDTCFTFVYFFFICKLVYICLLVYSWYGSTNDSCLQSIEQYLSVRQYSLRYELAAKTVCHEVFRCTASTDSHEVLQTAYNTFRDSSTYCFTSCISLNTVYLGLCHLK